MTISPVELKDIVAPSLDASDDSDERATKEIVSFGRAFNEETLRSLKQDNRQRADFAQKLYKLIVWWLIAIGVYLGLEGFGSTWGFFNLDDDVVIALLIGTTLNVLGIFYIVANYFFPKEGSSRRVSDNSNHDLPTDTQKA